MSATSTNTRIAAAFDKARAENRAALMPFLTVGYPTLDASKELILAIVEGGADIIEIGIPYGVVASPAAKIIAHAEIGRDRPAESARVDEALRLRLDVGLAEGARCRGSHADAAAQVPAAERVRHRRLGDIVKVGQVRQRGLAGCQCNIRTENETGHNRRQTARTHHGFPMETGSMRPVGSGTVKARRLRQD